MYNPILFVINSNGDVVKKSGIVRAINGYREYAVVITPLSSTAVSMSIMTDNGAFDKKEQYVLPTNLKVSNFVSLDDPLYQSIYDWNVYGVEIKEIALESIALFRTGKTTVAFQFQRIKASDKCVAYKGYFGIDLPLPQTAEIGDYYECEDYNYTIVSGTHNYTFTKGMYVYFNGVRWVKDRLLVELNTPTVEIAVEPSHATGYQLDDDDVNYLLPLGDNIVEALQKAELALQKIEDIKSGLEPLDELTLKDGQGNEMNVTFDGKDPIINYRGVSAELFKNLFLEVEPASGVTFTNDMQVMYAGSIGGSGKRLAKPTNLAELKENLTLYLGVITQITEDNHGIVNWYGVVNHINTSGQTLGAPVYVGNNGSWTTVKPISPLPIIRVGLIERVNNSQGQINVRPNVGNYLNQLHDVYTNGHTFVGGETIMFNLANGRYEVYDLAGKLQQVDDNINLLNSNKANKTYVDSQDAVLQSQINGNVSDIESLEIGKEDKSMKGQPNGYAPLDVSGYIPSAFVPNSFDDVIEFNTYADLLSYSMPQSNKLFVVKQDETSGGNHSTYRWTGTIYIRVTDEMSAAEIKVLYESNADTNPLTDVLKNNYNEAYAHSQIVNSNPHQTTYQQLLNKPTTIEELGVTNVYNKEYIDALKDKNGWESELLGTLSNNGTIALSVINQYDEIQMYAKDTLGVIDNENIRPSLIQSGDSVYFFDDTQAFIMVDTVFGFYAPVGYTLQVVGLKYTELKANDVATSEVGISVQDKIDNYDMLIPEIQNGVQENGERNREQDYRIATIEEAYRKSQNGELTATKSGTDIISLGKDVAPAPLQVKVDGGVIPALENLVTNGNFSGGTMGWTILNATGSVSGNIYSFTATARNGQIYSAYFNRVSGQVYYIVANVKADSNLVGIYSSQGITPQRHSGSGNYEKIVWGITASDIANWQIGIGDNRESGWTQIDVKFFMVFNLTELFGVTATSGTAYNNAVAEIEAELLANGGYISTTPIHAVGMNKRVRSVGKNLFDVSSLTTVDNANWKTWFDGLTLNIQHKTNFTTGLPVFTLPTIPNITYTIKLISSKATPFYLNKNGVYNVTLPSGTARTFASKTDVWTITPTGTTAETFTVYDIQLEQGTVATSYVPYANTDLYLQANKVGYKLPNGVVDTIEYRNGKYYYVQRVQKYVLQASDITAMFTDGTTYNYAVTENIISTIKPQLTNTIDYNTYISGMVETATFWTRLNSYYTSDTSKFRIATAVGTTLAQAQTALTGTVIYYQLATPIETEILALGNAQGLSGGTVYIDDIMADSNLYTSKYDIENGNYPIKSLDRIVKINADGSQTELAVSSAIIAGDGLSFTHHSLVANDIVWIAYAYNVANLFKSNTFITYYDNPFIAIQPNGTPRRITFSIDDSGVVTVSSQAV